MAKTVADLVVKAGITSDAKRALKKIITRRNEDWTFRFRSPRVFRVNGQWYFFTREGIDVGPFASQFEAEVEAAILISRLKNAEPEEYVSFILSHRREVRAASGLQDDDGVAAG